MSRAKIGRKDYAREPLERSAWREQLRCLAEAMLCVIAVMLVAAATVVVLR